MMPKRVLRWTAAAVPLALVMAFLVAYWRSDNACGDRTPSAPQHPMRAVIYCDYGSPDVLRIAEVEKPVPGDSDILVRVRAASVNALDWHFMRGTPYIGRLGMGLRRPRAIRMGVDFAGTVEAVGKSVTAFKVGDDVFGGKSGAFAEYVSVRSDRAVVAKPANLTFEQAAAIPVAGVTALQAVRDQARLKQGQRVLVNGATGGVGTFAVQIAKAFGGEVTGVCSSRNVPLVQALGADHVIDYTKDDFTRGPSSYDVIIDNVGNHSLSSLRHVLTPEGTYVIVGGPAGKWIDPFPRMLGAVVLSRFVRQDMRFFIATLNTRDLTLLRDLARDGRMTPAIDRTYELRDIRDAVRYVETGHARGKVVVTIGSR